MFDGAGCVGWGCVGVGCFVRFIRIEWEVRLLVAFCGACIAWSFGTFFLKRREIGAYYMIHT